MDELSLAGRMLLITLAVASVVVWILAAVRVRRGSPLVERRADPPPSIHWVSSFLTCGFIAMNVYLIGSTAGQTRAVPQSDALPVAMMHSTMILLAIFVPLTYDDGKSLPGLGLQLRRIRAQIAEGVLVLLALAAPVMIAWAATLPWRRAETQHVLLQLLETDSSLPTVIQVVLLAVVMAPLVEELMYRVVLQTALERAVPPTVAMGITAFIFAAVHGLPDAVALVPMAVILGYHYQCRRSFVSVVTAHMLFNAINIVLLFCGGSEPG